MSERLVRHDGRWYSPGLIAAEVAALSWLAADAPAATLVADPDVEGLSTDQAEAVGILAQTRTNGTVVVGPAGAGKTTMLARVAQAVGPGRVVAVAPTAVAAAQLGGSLGVQADTVAKILLDPERIPAGAWLIVDEATQLATREMAALCGRAQAAGARLVLVGDHAQQGSVTAGGVFASAARSGTVQVAPLSELWRFSDPAEAAATARLRVGDPTALRYHHRHGRVSSAAYTETAAAVGDWWEQHRDEATLISAPSHALVGEINAEIAARRAAAGETGPAVAGDGDRAIRIGDVITTRRNNRRVCASDNKWVRNGDRWIVEWTLGGGGLRARRVDDPYIRVDLPGGYVVEHVDLGYAVTHTRAQSTTVDAALTVVGASTRLPELYVGLTRGRNHNHLVVVTDRPAHDEDSPTQHLPPAEVIAAVLSRSSNQRTAIEPHQGTLDTHEAADHLQAVAETGHTAPLPTLDGFDTAAVLAARGAPTHSKATDLLEQRVRGAIDQWLAGLDGDALYEGLTDAEKAEVDQRLDAMLGGEEGYDDDHYEPTPDELAHLELDPADNEPGTVYPTDADDAAVWDDDAAPPPPFDEDDLEGWWDDTEDQIPDDLPAGWWDTAPAVADPDAPTFDCDDDDRYESVDTPTTVSDGEVQALFDPADTDGDLLATEQWLTDLGATSRVSELAVEIVTVAAGADPAEMFTPFPTTTPDNPELLTLTRRYSQAGYVAADEAAARTASLIAAVADAPLRDMLDPLVDQTLLSDDDSSWAQTVRADVLSRRAVRWAETLGALDTLRDTIRAQTERLIASGAHPQAVDSGRGAPGRRPRPCRMAAALHRLARLRSRPRRTAHPLGPNRPEPRRRGSRPPHPPTPPPGPGMDQPHQPPGARSAPGRDHRHGRRRRRSDRSRSPTRCPSPPAAQRPRRGSASGCVAGSDRFLPPPVAPLPRRGRSPTLPTEAGDQPPRVGNLATRMGTRQLASSHRPHRQRTARRRSRPSHPGPQRPRLRHDPGQDHVPSPLPQQRRCRVLGP